MMRALHSVLVQTFSDFEVVVVVDGPDEATTTVLQSVSDKRVRVFLNPRSLTAAGARNRGVAEARGTWIAFLDDDDEWLPAKLERQLAIARHHGDVLVTCLSRVITPLATLVWPEKVYDNVVPIDEYLFDRRHTFAGSGFIQTSSYMMPRALYQKSPFAVNTPHDDWDFLLRLSKVSGARVETVPEILVNVYFEEPRPSLSRTGTWLASLEWVDRTRPLLTRRAYSGFCLAVVGPRAAGEHAWHAFGLLLIKAFTNGAPRFRHVLIYFGFWLVPQGVRRQLRGWIRGHSR
jgi:glycosyltransferase involved in cell wall biosynthesis